MWHVKERSNCWLYSGPLSLEAQKILQALQAQRRHVARHNPRYSKHNHHLGKEQHGVQWEPVSQSFTSQERERNSQSHCHSETLAYSQSSQTQDLFQSSQASCPSCWDKSTNQREFHNLLSHGYSEGKNLEMLSPQSTQAMSFTQCERVLETDTNLSHTDRYTLSLQTPQSISEQQVAALKSSDKIIPFTIKIPPEGLKELYPMTLGQKERTEDPIFPTFYEMNSALIDKWPALDITENLSQRDLSGTTGLNLVLENKSCGLYFTNQMFSKGFNASENTSQTREEEQEVCDNNTATTEVPVVEMELVQPALSEDRISPLLPGSRDLNGTCNLSEGCNVPVIKTSDNLTTRLQIQIDSRNVLLFNGDTNLTIGEAKDVMEVEVEVAEEVIEEATVKESDVAVPDCSENKLGNKHRKIINIDSNGQDFTLGDMKPAMPSLNKQSESLQSEDSNCPASLESCECNDIAYHLTNTADPHLVNLKVPCKVQRDNMVNYEQERTAVTTVKSSSSHCISTSIAQNECYKLNNSTCKLPHLLPLKPSFALKRKYETLQPQSAHNISSKAGSTRCPPKWQPPQSSQEKKRDTKEKTNNKTPNFLEEKFSKDIKRCSTSADCTPLKQSRYSAKPNKPGSNHKGFRNQTKSKQGSLTSNLIADPRVTDASKMSQDDMDSIIKKAQQSVALVLTLVFRDGTTQLDPEQKQNPPVCGLLLLIKTHLDTVLETLGSNDSLVYLKLEHAPAWAQHSSHHFQEFFTRDLLLQVFSASQLVVCYKAKDVLRVLLQLYKRKLTWKQVEGCQIQDPQLSGWLLDPTDPATCFQDLLNKHCRNPPTIPALGTKKVSQIIACLYSLYKLNRELCSKLQIQGLWWLYSSMELKMIPVLAAMEVSHIYVDKEALRRTSDLLGTKMKQLEQEAHKAAGQMFLLTSSTQLRTVLFEKLHLHEQCENKRLPKTTNKQQSTSEAALLQLQDLHPLPKIILEYRQIHKIKSTFVDGILSCMMTKNYISSTWHQTSVVTGRISATHPNFQALPRQPLQVTRKLYIAGKEEEVVTVHPRAMFIPKEGWTFLSADFCQVELRLLAHLSSDPELLRVFTNPEADVFSMLASQWKGISETVVSSEDREHAKRIVYSVVYGAGLLDLKWLRVTKVQKKEVIGPERLSGILGVSTEQARRFQDSFLQTYTEVQNFIQKTVAGCQKKGYVLSIMGRRRTLHNINSPDWGVRMQAERQAVNFVVQGSAADLCKMAMIRIFNLLSTSNSLSARLIAQLHDELLYEVEDSQVEQFAALVKSSMESLEHMDQLNIHLKVPLKVAVSSGKSWGSMSELNILQSHPSF